MGRSPRRGICANRERACSFGKVPVVFKVYVTMELRKEGRRRGLGAGVGWRGRLGGRWRCRILPLAVKMGRVEMS